MAFNLKNRLPAQTPDDDDGISVLPWEDVDEPTDTDDQDSDEGGGDSEVFPIPVPPELADQTLLQSNTVATQSWVFRICMFFWGWTKFFATKSLQVVNDIRAKFIKSVEVHSDRIYTQRLTLIDNNGKPSEVFIKDGKIQIVYPFENVYIYPGSESSGLKFREFVYRNPDVAKNFIGLTPYEILANFVDISDINYETWRDRRCPFFCVADGEEKMVEKTVLISCPYTERITGITVLDENWNVLDRFDLPSGTVTRHVTINMPSFKPQDEDVEPTRVPLPENGPYVPTPHIQPFMPPFLLPPIPPCPFLNHGNVPPVPPGMPPELQQNIFEEDYLANDNLFEDFTETPDDGTTQIEPKKYDVVHEEYATGIYYNIPLKRSYLATNKKQFLFVETMKI